MNNLKLIQYTKIPKSLPLEWRWAFVNFCLLFPILQIWRNKLPSLTGMVCMCCSLKLRLGPAADLCWHWQFSCGDGTRNSIVKQSQSIHLPNCLTLLTDEKYLVIWRQKSLSLKWLFCSDSYSFRENTMEANSLQDWNIHSATFFPTFPWHIWVLDSIIPVPAACQMPCSSGSQLIFQKVTSATSASPSVQMVPPYPGRWAWVKMRSWTWSLASSPSLWPLCWECRSCLPRHIVVKQDPWRGSGMSIWG